MKTQLLILSLLMLGQSATFAQTAAECSALQQNLNSVVSTINQCRADRDVLNANYNAVTQDNGVQQTELNRLLDIKVNQLPQCRQAQISLPGQIQALRGALAQQHQQTAAAAVDMNQARALDAQLNAQNFLRFECVIKDKKYGYGGYGYGASPSEAEMNAVGDERSGMANKHGYNKICFKVFQARN